MSMIKIIFITPIYILIASFVLEKCVHKSDVITLLTYKFGLGIESLLHFVSWAHEEIGGVETCYDC